jgi:hypothetical protein
MMIGWALEQTEEGLTERPAPTPRGGPFADVPKELSGLA